MAKAQKALIIVESPTKIKTLRKILGANFSFESSVGHIRDLPEKEFGIDLDHDFEPTYVTMPDKQHVIAKLKKAASEADIVYLAPDPDREGEAIAWHIQQILPAKTKTLRVTFNAITRDAVTHALETPREIDESMVNAQQARRLLDRIVGYKISPILNRRIQRGREGFVSAGRVQSVALKLVVDREKEIQAFKPVEYWNLGAIFKAGDFEKTFRAYLYSFKGQRIEKEALEGKDYFLVPDKTTADALLARLQKGPYRVETVEKKEKRRNPVAPFITSTLQQEASRHYNFSSTRTMSIAQSLYEGVELGHDGIEGLITYMRTDSVRVVPEAIQEARRFITKTYGENYIPSTLKVYETQKSAQDAHEAIRPSSLIHTPESIQPYVTREQFLLYQLIWRRFLASQMLPAIYDTVTADISAGPDLLLRATGSQIKFSGFLAVYEEKHDEEDKDDENRVLPPLEEKQLLDLQELTSEQAFTRAPARFTEASLIKELEKSGIGRPSTYTSIMNKIQSRDYTIKEGGRLKPTELGFVIAALLEANFAPIMNIGFTAEMEDDLEKIAEGQENWKQLLADFWQMFKPIVETAEKEGYVPKLPTDIDCPTCGAKLQKIWFKNKYFYGCTRYPDCTYSAQIEEITFNKDDYAANFKWDQKCPQCESEMKVRHGRFGSFLGCTRYPDCKGIINIPKKGELVIAPEEMPHCPAIDCPGKIVARKSRFGKTFYSCSTYPECDVIVNQIDQLAEKYPHHPRTPYLKVAKKGKGRKGAVKAEKTSAVKKTSAKKTSTKETKKEAPKKAKSSTGAKQPAQKLSPSLAEIVGTDSLSRPQVVKKLWEYIREHDLQNPENKQMINSDKKLAALFGTSEPVSMFKMNALLKPHFLHSI